MEGAPDPDCPFCSAKLTLEHILSQSKETEEERRKSNMTKGEKGAKMVVEYVKISDYTTDYRHQYPNRNVERTYKKRRKKPQTEKDNEERQQKLELRKK
jgi:hypothetical protein